MLSTSQKASLDAVKISINRTFNYGRADSDIDDADITLELENGQVTIHGSAQCLDELEYAVARLIAAFRKEVSHGKVVQPTKELAWK